MSQVTTHAGTAPPHHRYHCTTIRSSVLDGAQCRTGRRGWDRSLQCGRHLVCYSAGIKPPLRPPSVQSQLRVPAACWPPGLYPVIRVLGVVTTSSCASRLYQTSNLPGSDIAPQAKKYSFVDSFALEAAALDELVARAGGVNLQVVCWMSTEMCITTHHSRYNIQGKPTYFFLLASPSQKEREVPGLPTYFPKSLSDQLARLMLAHGTALTFHFAAPYQYRKSNNILSLQAAWSRKATRHSTSVTVYGVVPACYMILS